MMSNNANEPINNEENESRENIENVDRGEDDVQRIGC